MFDGKGIVEQCPPLLTLVVSSTEEEMHVHSLETAAAACLQGFKQSLSLLRLGFVGVFSVIAQLFHLCS